MIFDANIFLSTAYYVLYALVVALPYVFFKPIGGQRDPLDPYLATSLLLFFYVLSALQAFEATGLAATVPNASASTVAKFAFVCLVGQFGLAMGDITGRLHARPTYPAHAASIEQFNLLLLTGPALLLALVALPFYIDRFNFFSVSSYAETAFTSRITRNLDDTKGPVDVFLREMPTSVLLCACTVFLFDWRRAVLIRLAAGAAIAAFALKGLLGGARSDLASSLLLPLMYYHYLVRRLSPTVVITVAALGYFVMHGLEFARLSSDPFEMFELLMAQIRLEGAGFLDVDRFNELQTSLNLVRIIGGIDQAEEEFRWGVVILFNFLSTIPRALWPGRPPTGSELFAEVFYPGSLEAGQGFGSFIFQDPYWDFGFAGVFLFGFALAWSVRHIYIELVINRGSPFWILLYAILYHYMVVHMIRGGIFAGIKGALVSAGPLLLIAMLPRVSQAERRTI